MHFANANAERVNELEFGLTIVHDSTAFESIYAYDQFIPFLYDDTIQSILNVLLFYQQAKQ
ncbi:MAG: hypothetical protein WAK17_27470 [Candidatus Nitrosopolaris sp.]